ncbi:MAG: hypothetical protein EOO53_20545 [Gammaproteobacteria bacterium]|nr:MAG: hypothetical protein EOO53_20545 [Gammaproteobacteria bacterium]
MGQKPDFKLSVFNLSSDDIVIPANVVLATKELPLSKGKIDITYLGSQTLKYKIVDCNVDSEFERSANGSVHKLTLTVRSKGKAEIPIDIECYLFDRIGRYTVKFVLAKEALGENSPTKSFSLTVVD